MERSNVQLTTSELAVLDSLIAVAQGVGYDLDLSDEEDCDYHVCEVHADDFMGRWQDTRHDGVILAYVEHEILPRLKDLVGQVDQPTTLRRLMQLRGAATRQRR